MHIGKALAELRRKKGLPQKQIYLYLGFTQANVSELERDFSSPRPTTVERYCAVLGVPVAAALLFAIDESEIPLNHLAEFRQLKSDISK